MSSVNTPPDVHAGRLIDAVQDDEVQGMYREMDRLWDELESVKREVSEIRRFGAPTESSIDRPPEFVERLVRVALLARHIQEEHTPEKVLETAVSSARKHLPMPSNTSREHARRYRVYRQVQRDLYENLPQQRAPREYVPATFVQFHSLGMIVMTLFGTLLVLDVVFGVQTIHPVISGLGFAGGVSWFVTALVDIKSWREQMATAGS